MKLDRILYELGAKPSERPFVFFIGSHLNWKKALAPFLEETPPVAGLFRIYLIFIAGDLDNYQINRVLIQMGDVKQAFAQAGYKVSAELIKLTKGEHGDEEILIDYANNNNGVLMLDSSSTALFNLDLIRKKLHHQDCLQIY